MYEMFMAPRRRSLLERIFSFSPREKFKLVRVKRRVQEPFIHCLPSNGKHVLLGEHDEIDYTTMIDRKTGDLYKVINDD